MKATFEPVVPVQRTVDVEMTEDEARILRAVTGKLNFSTAVQAYRDFSYNYPNQASDDQIKNAVYALFTSLDDVLREDRLYLGA